MTPVDIMERGTEERVVQRTRIAGNAELYLSMRRRNLEQTHQQALDEFAQGLGAQYPDVASLARAYFAKWGERYDESMGAYNARLKEIREDQHSSSMERARAIQMLRPPMYPAWDEDRERGYLNTYGDPRDNVADWNNQLAWIAEPEVEAQNGNSNVIYRRTQWEQFVPFMLEHPEIDRSVAPCMQLAFGRAATLVDPQGRAIATRDAFAPEVPEGPIDQKLYAAMMKQAKTVCPHCYEPFPRGLAAHEPACARKHGVGTEEVQDASTD